MVTERTTIIFGKEQLANIEAYLKSISTSLEALLDIYNLVVPKLIPDLDTEEEDEEEEEEEVCDCKKKEEDTECHTLEAELKDVLTMLLKLF